MNITEFKYRYDPNGKEALVLYRYTGNNANTVRVLFVMFISVVSSRTLMGRNIDRKGQLLTFSWLIYMLVLLIFSVGIYTDHELRAMVERMESSKLKTVNLTNNDLAKDHLRYFVSFIAH